MQDSKRRTSNAATLTVVVKPDPGAAITIASFEGEGDAALDGWASADWEDAGTVAVTSAYATQGSQVASGPGPHRQSWMPGRSASR